MGPAAVKVQPDYKLCSNRVCLENLVGAGNYHAMVREIVTPQSTDASSTAVMYSPDQSFSFRR